VYILYIFPLKFPHTQNTHHFTDFITETKKNVIFQDSKFDVRYTQLPVRQEVEDLILEMKQHSKTDFYGLSNLLLDRLRGKQLENKMPVLLLPHRKFKITRTNEQLLGKEAIYSLCLGLENTERNEFGKAIK
jgi:hypothetical protein